MYRNDIFKPGQGYAWGPETDFNQLFKLFPGDVVGIPAGYYEYIDIARLDGITFVNEGGQAVIGSMTLHGGCISPKLLGNGVTGLKYGFKFTNPQRFGCGWDAVGDMEAAYFEVDGCQIGFQLLNYPDRTYPVQRQNISLHDYLIQNTAFEAVYIGHYIAGGIFMNGRIADGIVKRAGNDGIQCRNGRFDVVGNHLEDIGLGGNDSHAQGILFGGNTNGGSAAFNTLLRVGGYGIFANGFGDFTFAGNTIESNSSGVFTKNHEPEQDLQKVGYQKFLVMENTIKAANGKPIESYFKAGSVPSTVIDKGNIYTGVPYIEPGVTYVKEGATGPVPPAPEKKLLWTAYKVVSGVKKYYNVYSDFTWSWK